MLGTKHQALGDRRIMGATALAEPQIIKISSKRQITIPAKFYEGGSFKEYALATWTDDGLLIQPLDVDNEDVTVDILRYLIGQGCEGEDLIARYQEMKRKIIPVSTKLDEAERDIVEGRVDSYENMRARLRERYGF